MTPTCTKATHPRANRPDPRPGLTRAARCGVTVLLLTFQALLTACGLPPSPLAPTEPAQSPPPTREQLHMQVRQRLAEIVALLGDPAGKGLDAVKDADALKDVGTCTAAPQHAHAHAGHGYRVHGRATVPVPADQQPAKIEAVYSVWKATATYHIRTVGSDHVAAADYTAGMDMDVDGTTPQLGLVVNVHTIGCFPLPPPPDRGSLRTTGDGSNQR